MQIAPSNAVPTQIALFAHVDMQELRSEAARFLLRVLITVPEYFVSFSTAKETPATTEGAAEADAEGAAEADAEVDVVLEALTLLDEEAVVELTGAVVELRVLEELELEELEELETFWYMFRPLDPPQI